MLPTFAECRTSLVLKRLWRVDVAAVVIALLAGGCDPSSAPATPHPASTPVSLSPSAQPNLCAACQAPVTWGRVQLPAVREASGLAASGAHPGLLYVHNDSGDKARFFAVDRSGADQGTFEVTGASAVDWEDIALGPCPTGSCLYIADVGDNDHKRTSYTIYRVREPDVVGTGKHAVTAEAFPFTYPDGIHDAETLLVHPRTGMLTVVTKAGKRGGPASTYEMPLPLDRGRTAMLVRAGDANVPADGARITGGAVHPSGTFVLLRTHTSLLLYPMSPDGSVAQALAAAPCALPAREEKGEGVAWLPSGEGFVTVGEGGSPVIHYVGCAR